MLIENQHMHNKSLTVAVLGEPNVGKSSLVNALMGMELSAVTHKPQTTRNKISCIFQLGYSEIILVDTPGVHTSAQEINLRMVGQARESGQSADLNLILIDATLPLEKQWESFLKFYRDELKESWLLFAKKDLINFPVDFFQSYFNQWKESHPFLQKFFVISSKTQEGIDTLKKELELNALPGPHHYPGGDVSNKNERFFVGEYIREQAFLCLKEELPYELAVVVDDFMDLREEPGLLACEINATLLVNRPSQRGIVVGSKGSMIKNIGIGARKRIEALVGGQVRLNLHVKVSPRWFKNNFILESLGLPRVPESHRVWRSKT